MDNEEFSFINMSQYGQIPGTEPLLVRHRPGVGLQHSIQHSIQQNPSHHVTQPQHLQEQQYHFAPTHQPQQQSGHEILHSVSQLIPSKVGKRQTNRQKYTDEEVQQICSMKEAGMPWSKIAAHFPGRSQKSLQVSYCVNFKKRKERFEDEDKELLRTVLQEETVNMWERVSNRLGKSVESCRQKAKELGLQ